MAHKKKHTILSITETRKNIFEITKDIADHQTVYTLTERGTAVAVLMSQELFLSWQQTVYMMQRYPGVVQDIDQSVQDIKLAQYISLEEVLHSEGYIVSDKVKQEYGVSSSSDQNSKNES